VQISKKEPEEVPKGDETWFPYAEDIRVQFRQHIFDLNPRRVYKNNPTLYADFKDSALNLYITSLFNFEEPIPKWKTYPQSKLSGSFKGHDVRYVTLEEDQEELAKFCISEMNSTSGFNAQLRIVNKKPTILVDLNDLSHFEIELK